MLRGDMEFKASGQGEYKFYRNGAYYDLSNRFDAVEADVATNAANPVPAQNTQAIADMQVAYQAKDAQIEAAAAAEVGKPATAPPNI